MCRLVRTRSGKYRLAGVKGRATTKQRALRRLRAIHARRRAKRRRRR